MKAIVRVCAVLAISAPMFASWAQQPDIRGINNSFRFAYDTRREVTVTGNVHGISVRGKAPSGPHLLITTSHGLIDAHLGSFAFQGSQPVSLHSGEQVSVVGVMTQIDGSQILLARTVNTTNKTFVVRNEHGVLLFPRAAAHGHVRFKVVSGKGEQQ